jgi:cytochrome c biogenesis protein CcdA
MAGVLAFLFPLVLAGGLFALVITLRNSAETAMSQAADWLPVGYAFGAGMVASVNPCGFLMLPSYVSYHLGTNEEGFYDSSSRARIAKALILAGMATLGFVAVFTVGGAVISAGGNWLVRVVPYFGIAIGVAMFALGLWLLITHRTLGIMAASRLTITPQRNLRNAFTFGIVYAVGSLSCTLPIFLVVVGGALAGGGLLFSMGQFLGYALGMGSVLGAVTLATALFKGAVARWVGWVLPYVHRVSALFLLGAGAYLVYYWAVLGAAPF